MLKTIEIIEGLEAKYAEMIKLVNVPDFYKCIAQFSGLHINQVNNNVIKEYLIRWAKNKYLLFEMLGKKLRVDEPFEYDKARENIFNELQNLQVKYPIYAPWLDAFGYFKKNKIEHFWDHIDYHSIRFFKNGFKDFKFDGSTITHFFKKKLNAPDELVTEIGRIFENDVIKANHTVSIDPVDMMLASETPYDWQSCYRLEVPNDSSHADGCLAAVLDRVSAISYVWHTEGKYNMYSNYDFKSIRYKIMRRWLVIDREFEAIHFNKIYPNDDLDDELHKKLRDLPERLVAKYNNKENVWVNNSGMFSIFRVYSYGYSEFDEDRIYRLKNMEDRCDNIEVYDEPIYCPCGCGKRLTGSYSIENDSDSYDDYDEDSDIEYNGAGFIHSNFILKEYCEYADENCANAHNICAENCRGCRWYNECHPVCELNMNIECPAVDEADDGIAYCSVKDCIDCPHYQEHKIGNSEKTEVNLGLEDIAYLHNILTDSHDDVLRILDKEDCYPKKVPNDVMANFIDRTDSLTYRKFIKYIKNEEGYWILEED